VTVDAVQAAQPSVVPSPPDLAPIANVAVLLDHGAVDLRGVVLDVLAAGLRAADPGSAVDRLVEVDGPLLRVAGRSFDLDAARSVVLLGAGKASLSIAVALERMLGDRISRGLIVRRSGAPGELSHVDVMDADHPVPSEASLAAGQRLVELASTCGPGDLLITAFTGGSSALACLPPEGVSLQAKQHLHSLLLDSGASIAEVNAVRKHVSRIKGGRLAACAPGATILNLTLSDVVGDAVDLLCDVMVQDTSDVEDAVAVLRQYALWDEVAPVIRRHLESEAAQSPSLADLDITTCVLVTGSTVVDRMAEQVRSIGWTPVVLGSSLAGDAASLGGLLGALATESSTRGRPFTAGSVLVAAGGEATVSIHRRVDSTLGCGGPNQEVAIAFAAGVDGTGAKAAAAFVDSDGSDGGTVAAGGCIDHTSSRRACELGLDLDIQLLHHDSMVALEQMGDLVMTGPTGTNISDLVVVAIAAAAIEDPSFGMS
jgi:glycerate 2-kinase